jgi:serine phosphatase RsbU (regulator of sigma subunit)
MYSDLGCDLVGFYRGAEKCSGDWWWYEHISQDKLWVIVADVTGHGAGPAMLTAAVAMGIWVQQTEQPYSDKETTRMSPGDRLIITTDGIIETTLVGGRPLGFRRFVNVLREVRGIPIGQAVQKVVNDVDVARAAQPQEDDFTFCMLERR